MGQPNEYDLNIVLYNEALMQYSKLVESHPGFLQIQVDMKGFRQYEALMTGTAQAQFEGLLSRSGGLKYLMPKAVNQWLFNVVKKAYGLVPKKIELDNAGFRKIKHFDIEQNGPALTLMLELTNGHKVDLDLVPVLPFKPNCLRKFDMRPNLVQPQWLSKKRGLPKAYRMDVSSGLRMDFFAIPKLGPSDLDWGIHFPSAEKKIIKNLGCVKPVIRYLKLFRDTNQPLSKVKSYALVTVVMKMIRRDFNFWIQNSPFLCFLSALENLEKVIRIGYCGWFFNEKCNILPEKYYPPQKCAEMSNFLRKAICDMKRSEKNLRVYFK